jgi:hypothetical protein
MSTTESERALTDLKAICFMLLFDYEVVGVPSSTSSVVLTDCTDGSTTQHLSVDAAVAYLRANVDLFAADDRLG